MNQLDFVELVIVAQYAVTVGQKTTSKKVVKMPEEEETCQLCGKIPEEDDYDTEVLKEVGMICNGCLSDAITEYIAEYGPEKAMDQLDTPMTEEINLGR